jgi:hypothetical protein
MIFLTKSHFDSNVLALHLDLNIHFRSIQGFQNLVFYTIVKDLDSQKLLTSNYGLAKVSKSCHLTISFYFELVKYVVGGPTRLNGFKLLSHFLENFLKISQTLSLDIIGINLLEFFIELVFFLLVFVLFLVVGFLGEVTLMMIQNNCLISNHGLGVHQQA